MPHITEGLLHAHLDGALGPDEQLQWAEAEAHLEVCDDCRRRLDEAAELRDAARDLLAGATPSRSATRPAFDELVSRARVRQVDSASGRKSPARAGGAWWRTPATLGWAASLVIAAGAGWIGRQLVVEQGLDVPPVAAERDTTVGRGAAGEGAALDDLREDATPEERVGRDAAAAPAPPETAARLQAEAAEAEAEAEPLQEGGPEAEELLEKAEPRADPQPEADADAEAGGDALRRQEIAPLTAGAETNGSARCYAASPAADDDREAAAGEPETLRLAPDGTATLRLDGRPMVGFWQGAAADSLHLRVTDGGAWRELTVIEAEDGVRGDADLDEVDCP